MFLPEDKRLPQLVDRSKERWTKKIEPRIASTLGDRPWILGHDFTAADVMVGSTLAWARMANVLGPAPVLASYLERISKRPAFIETYS
jgi:glutathione S-transferase